LRDRSIELRLEASGRLWQHPPTSLIAGAIVFARPIPTIAICSFPGRFICRDSVPGDGITTARGATDQCMLDAGPGQCPRSMTVSQHPAHPGEWLNAF
jgi:hypothetical protein